MLFRKVVTYTHAQPMANGTERPIGYVPRSLNAAERGYSTTEKEALAIIFGVKKFSQFLYGYKFKIDHKPLKGLSNENKRSAPTSIFKRSAVGP